MGTGTISYWNQSVLLYLWIARTFVREGVARAGVLKLNPRGDNLLVSKLHWYSTCILPTFLNTAA